MQVYIAVSGLDAAQRKRIVDAVAPDAAVFADAMATQPQRQQAIAASAIVFGNVPADWLVAAPSLRWVQLDSAGVDAYLLVNARRAELGAITFTHLRDFFDRAVSEAALGGILAWHRQLPRLLEAQRASRWIKEEVEPDIRQLHGAHVILLGAGSIGRRVGQLLAAFECRVDYFSRHSPLARLHTTAELDAALPGCDLLINTLPHTPETVNLLDAARLARLPRTAVVVNVGRGSALDETALLDALDSGRLAGAVLDVTREEPLPQSSPLWRHPRVILTQHTGGRFPGETDAKIDVFVANLQCFRRSEPLHAVVELARGY